MSMSGGCLCGRVRYEVTAPMLFGGFCYCMDCRKQSGSHSASMAVPEAAVQMTGETREFETTGDSGSQVKRVFCPNCGERLPRPEHAMAPGGPKDITNVQPPPRAP